MKNLYQCLLLLIAGSTENQLAAHVRYLKGENQVLRSKLPKRISLLSQEKNRLVKFAARLGQAIDSLATIASPSTTRRWIRESKTPGGIKQAAFRAPNTNAFVERFIQTLQQECLDYFVVFGQEHMDLIVNVFVAHCHEERPHQSKDNAILRLQTPSDTKEEKLDAGRLKAPLALTADSG